VLDNARQSLTKLRILPAAFDGFDECLLDGFVQALALGTGDGFGLAKRLLSAAFGCFTVTFPRERAAMWTYEVDTSPPPRQGGVHTSLHE